MGYMIFSKDGVDTPAVQVLFGSILGDTKRYGAITYNLG